MFSMAFVPVALVALFVRRSLAFDEELFLTNRSLEGRRFSCCAVKEFPKVYHRPGVNFYNLDGTALAYLSLLEQRLGFRCKSMKVFNSHESYHSFDRILPALRGCAAPASTSAARAAACSCEVAVGGWVQTPRRHDLVTFLPGYVQSEVRVAARVGSFRRPGTDAFFLTFGPHVWACILVLLFYLLSLKVIDGKITQVDCEGDSADAKPPPRARSADRQKRAENSAASAQKAAASVSSDESAAASAKDSSTAGFPEKLADFRLSDANNDDKGEGVSKYAWFTSHNAVHFRRGVVNFVRRISVSRTLHAYVEALDDLLGSAQQKTTPPTGRPRCSSLFLRLVITLNVFILIVAYEAALVTSLLSNDVISSYRSIEDLHTCKVPPESVCVPLEEVTRNLWRESIATHDCHRNRSAVFIAHYKEADFLHQEHNQCKFMLIGPEAEELDCAKMVIVGKPLLRSSLSFIFPKSTPRDITQAFSIATLQLREQGKLSFLNTFPESKDKGKCGQKVDNRQINLHQMSSFFIFIFSLGAFYLLYAYYRARFNA